MKRDSLKLDHTDSGKKFVTFGNTHFVENTSLSGQSANSGSDNQEKPDLPGRVSFSKSDVYEIDFSDYENDNEILAKFSTSANKTSFNKLVRSSSSINTRQDDCDQDLQSFCCSLKCNSMACTIDESETASTDKISTKDEHSDHLDTTPDTNAVIEDYKKEIESLNRKHENDIAEREEAIDAVSLSPAKHDVPRLQFTNYSDSVASSGDNTNITKKYNEKTAFNNSNSLNLANLKPLNNSGDSEHHSKPTSNEVINNYLKTTNQKDIYTQSTPKQNNLSMAPKPTKFSKKTKQPLSDKTKSKLKLGENLDEFQMEKVESWMSIHEKSFSNSKCDIVDGGAYNNEWRESNSHKTDDEGNFSFEDPIDDTSNEESNYDEIVSVIKEIDEEKIKDLGKLH